MSLRYDAIIVGGGHNGLVCAAYLARGGKRVLVRVDFNVPNEVRGRKIRVMDDTRIRDRNRRGFVQGATVDRVGQARRQTAPVSKAPETRESVNS